MVPGGRQGRGGGGISLSSPDLDCFALDRLAADHTRWFVSTLLLYAVNKSYLVKETGVGVVVFNSHSPSTSYG